MPEPGNQKVSAKSPSYPGPVALDGQDNGLWALQEGGLIRLKGGALPGCKISQQAGWIRGGGRSGQERVQRGRKQKACSFTILWGRLDPGTHSTHPRYNCSSGIYRSGVSPARGTRTRPGSAKLPERAAPGSSSVKETHKFSPVLPALGKLGLSNGRRMHFRTP